MFIETDFDKLAEAETHKDDYIVWRMSDWATLIKENKRIIISSLLTTNKAAC